MMIFSHEIYFIIKLQALKQDLQLNIPKIHMHDSSPKRFSTSYRSTLQQSTLSGLSANVDLQRLLREKQINEERLLRELAYKEETLQLFQSEKNIKMDQYQLQVEEEMLRLRRKFEVEIDALNRKIMDRDREIRDNLGKQEELELVNARLAKELDELQRQFSRTKQDNIGLNGHINKLTEAVKLLEVQELQLKQKNADMEQQIFVLLQIQSDKSKQIVLLSQNQRALEIKNQNLQSVLIELERQIKVVNERVQSRQGDCEQLKFIIGKMDAEIQSKQLSLVNAEKQVQQAIRRQKIREAEVEQLMVENERLYGQVTREKHKLKELAIQYKLIL